MFIMGSIAAETDVCMSFSRLSPAAAEGVIIGLLFFYMFGLARWLICPLLLITPGFDSSTETVSVVRFEMFFFAALYKSF